MLSLGHIIAAFTDTNPRMLGKDIVEGRKIRRALKPNTAEYYRNAARLVENLDGGTFWVQPVEAFNGRTIALLLDRAEICHGLARARATRAMLSQAYAYAVAARVVRTNPVKQLEERLPVLAPRVRYGSIEEIRTLVAAADLVGRPEIGDMVLLGVWSGQRQSDRLTLTEAQIRDLTFAFRQAKKHGQPLSIPVAQVLEKRFADKLIRKKAREEALRKAGKKVILSPLINIDESAGRPFRQKHYQHVFAEVRAAAAYGLWRTAEGELISKISRERTPLRYMKCASVTRLPRGAVQVLEGIPSLHDLRDQDLRDTAVTWLARAGCDKLEIAAITGHSLNTIDQVLEHYFGLHPDLAKRAIGKLEGWYEEAEG